MARQWRIEFPGAIYHVLSRGNGRQDIFRSDDDRRLFLELIGQVNDRFDIEVHAYVLMSNHYHLLLKTREANLSKAMQWLGTTYTRRFNLKNRHCGHLFQGRFKSIIVENDAYLLRLSCYIHRNPLRAGLVSRLIDYPWSSYRAYAYGRKQRPDWLTTETLLNQLGGEDRYNAYRTMAQQYAKEQSSVWEDVRYGLIYGSRDFVAAIKSRFLGEGQDSELPQQNRLLRATDSKMILESASKFLAFDLESARRAKRITPVEKEKRDMLIFLLWKTGRLSNKQIGNLMGVTYSTVSKIISAFDDRIKKDYQLQAQYDTLYALFKV